MDEQLRVCKRCFMTFGEHAREELKTEHGHGWVWGKNACPVGPTPFHPTQVFDGPTLLDMFNEKQGNRVDFNGSYY